MENNNLYKLRMKLRNLIPLQLRLKIRLLKLNKEIKKIILRKPKKIEVEKTIVVLGMHRSGTSLTSNILNNFEIAMGENLTKYGKDNPRGFFEDEQFVRLNNKILYSAGGCWDNPPSHSRIITLKKNKKLMKEIKELILSQQDKVWGWKDPVTTLTIDLYLPFIKNPYFIACYRNPSSVKKSLIKRNKYSIEQPPMKIISTYNKRLSNFLNRIDYPKLEVHYEDYFKNPSEQITKIKKFLRLKKDTNQVMKAIDKNLKHF
jgi:hypothetical protein